MFHDFRYLCGVLAACLLLPLPAYGQDSPYAGVLPASRAGIASRTSPFDPPSTDVFLVDDGPGLDTGCTFNTSPGAPLVISVVVDRAVGEVDANGYLVDPAPLIARGIIPARVPVRMPAYDVDFNGESPPERDEVLLNGEVLGFLTGDNNIWVPNRFDVDIDKIKFPAPPAPGATPTPVVNTIQINIDTLSTGRWCTSIDWVALFVPIRPRVALTLEPRVGNRIRQNDSESTIDVIFRQSFDADCNVTTDIGPYDEYPFSGSAHPLSASLHAKIEGCPRGSLVNPQVIVDWTIDGTALSGASSWTGLEGEVDLAMPPRIGAYGVDLTFDITGEGEASASARRKLLVTREPPRATVDPPRLTWLEKGTTWASGLQTEGAVFQSVMNGLYGYGRANWRYGYDFGAAVKCNWQELVASPLSCNYSDCFVFSDVLDNICAALGVGGLAAQTPTGSAGLGFMTGTNPSLDPAFPGSAKPLGGSAYDRYVFSSHSLREKGGSYYDSTFNQIYASATQFIAANLDGGVDVDANGVYQTTVEGTKIYDLGSSVYDSWGDYAYSLAPFAPIAPRLGTGMSVAAASVQFTGSATFTPRDVNGDGYADVLASEVGLELLAPGSYTVVGVLKKGNKVVANRPRFESMLTARTVVKGAAGPRTASLEFSGEQIFRSGEDGPYDLQVFAVGAGGPASALLPTPALDHRRFGELGAGVASVTEAAVDENGDGRFDAVEVVVQLQVRTSGDYQLDTELSRGQSSITRATAKLTLPAGAQAARLRLPGQPIRRAGNNGPFNGVVNLLDAQSNNLGSTRFVTQAYRAEQFATLFILDGRFSDDGLDTNRNGLFELLRVTFGVEVTTGGVYLVSGVLRDPTRPLVVFTESAMTLAAGVQELPLEFSGRLIHRQAIDGPYEVEVVARDPATLREIDRVTLAQTTADYLATDFESFEGPQPPIALTGDSFDVGLDLNGNGQFDELHVEVELALTTADFYRWSARLADANGKDLGFSSGNGNLPAGTVSIGFVFNGATIGANGVDGPYYVTDLLIFGASGANLVAFDVAQTRPYRVFEFEGGNHPPVADAGPDQTIECASAAGAVVTLDGTRSFDADNDVLTYTWTGPFGVLGGPKASVTLPLGSHVITLTVEDGRGGAATDTVVVSVVDTTPPAVTAALAPSGIIRPKKGRFVVQYACADRCDASPTTVATLNGIPVTSAQQVFLKLAKRTRALYRHGALWFLQAPSFALSVRCTDDSGNTGVAVAAPVFPPCPEPEDDDEDDDDCDD